MPCKGHIGATLARALKGLFLPPPSSIVSHGALNNVGSKDREKIIGPKASAFSHQRIKDTPGITGLSGKRVHIDFRVWHLDVGSSRPDAEEGIKG